MPETAFVHVIDDDEAVRNSLHFLLDAAGLPVRTYGSATEFLTESGQYSVGCILTDMRMPDMSGLALQRRLTELGSTL
ncbi:MAG: response regulator, partial [Acetobacteraceae bacterium]|nr:response regulator [Acetobacteraceae bacterium]